ncbi:MAG: NTP transferase domain-containing protein [Deltaproteobacteria bacterium]|nr:NTP transferase domain-containing protein [Deltaproteobacteria bacterium]
MQNREIAAIVLAAGYASRMGRLKPLLPLGGGTVVRHTIRSFQHAGITEIIVVLGHRYGDIIPVLEKNHIAWVVNPQYEKGMMGSIRKGVEALREDTRAFFIMPADIPLVRPSTIIHLIKKHSSNPSLVVYPAFKGQRGHPPLIPVYHREGILRWTGTGGLRRYLGAREKACMDVATTDSGVLMDMDTPRDYENILEKSKNMDIPTREEALAFLMMHQGSNTGVIRHANVVASVAVEIGTVLNRTGSCLDLRLIEAAGLLHDIAKGQESHAARAASLATEEGFSKVADIVSVHMNIVPDPAGRIGEKEIVYLADKMVHGSEIVSLEKRLNQKIVHFAGNLKAIESVSLRMENAIKIQRDIENIIGKPMGDLFSQLKCAYK